MSAGRLRTIATIRRIRPDAEADASGRIDLTDEANWREVWKGFVEVIAVTARERIYAQQPVHDITHRVTLRKSARTAEIQARDKVFVQGRTFQVGGMIDVGSPVKFVELSCVEVR